MKKVLLSMLALSVASNVCAAEDISGFLFGEKTAIEEEKENVYIFPNDVKCSTTEGVTFCTDQKGQPITGEMQRYRDNKLIRSYHFVKGYLQGKNVNYYLTQSDVVESEKSYAHGKLNGVTTKYYITGKMTSSVPYVEGKKEGVAKFYNESGIMILQNIYVADKLNGPAKVYDGGKTAFDVVYANNKLVSGTCTYIEETSEEDAGVENRQEEDLYNTRQLSKEEISNINKGIIHMVPKIKKGNCNLKVGKSY